MTDISKCFGKGCRRKKTCYRFNAPHGEWQSYIAWDKEPKKCDRYWPVKKYVTDRLKG